MPEERSEIERCASAQPAYTASPQGATDRTFRDASSPSPYALMSTSPSGKREGLLRRAMALAAGEQVRTRRPHTR